MMSASRYDTSGLPEDQFEPGSDGKVLRNLRGIISPEEMATVETDELLRVSEHLLGEVGQEQTFTVQDIYGMHRQWLESIYSWAGKERQVNISKDGFSFAMARTIPNLMSEFERKQLACYTPCRFTDSNGIAGALAEVHVELMLIHPFREGNGRLGRLVATLMALQAGLPPLDYRELAGERKEEYFAAVRMGMVRDYAPMTQLFVDVIETSS